ncbi:MaoC family dehydratase [Rhizobium jaguaris]|uniref:MaoC family dehydratase n=1 Tax=Rhizobium jaguaris TaxID=1312183 RepID=UPI0013C4D5AB|nr:MaoC family dehydratase [Rhizobium jaguaris]
MPLSTDKALFPRSLAVHVQLDDDPRYRGSIHDDDVARARGYKAALVPGAFVYGHISRVAIEAWGQAWAERGGMSARFRRPVYNGDVLTIKAGELTDDPQMRRAEIRAVNEEGEEVASGWVGLRDAQPVAPDISGFAILPRPETPPRVAAGALRPGMPVTTADRVLTETDFRKSLSAFSERHPLYSNSGFVHSGCLMRLAMGDTNNSFAFPAPVVLTSAEAQHFGLVRPGQRLTTAGRITDASLRKGKYYFESEEFMMADGVLVARFLRTSIYAYA